MYEFIIQIYKCGSKLDIGIITYKYISFATQSFNCRNNNLHKLIFDRQFDVISIEF